MASLKLSALIRAIPPTHLLLAIVILALLLRLPLLNDSFWLDEAAQALQSARPLSQQFAIQADFQPPLYHVVVHVLASISHAEWWLRLASLIPSLISIYLTYILARSLSTPRLGLIAALVVTLSHFHLFYAQELRPYMFASVFVLLSFILLTQKKSSHQWWQLGVVNALGLLSVYTYVFYFLSQPLWLRFYPKMAKTWAKSLLVTLAASLWWLPYFIGQLQAGLNISATIPGWNNAVSLPFLKALPLTFVKFFFGRFPIPDSLAAYLILGLLILGLGFLMVTYATVKNRHVLVLAIAPILMAWLITPFLPTLEPKRFLGSLPLLFIVATLAAAKSRLGKALLMLVVSTNLLIISAYWVKPELQREPWRQAITGLESQFGSDATVVFRFYAPFSPWEWYATGSLPSLSTGSLYLDSITPLNTTLSPSKSSSTVLVFDYLKELTDPQDFTHEWLIRQGFQPISSIHYPNLGAIKQYTRQPLFATTFAPGNKNP
jgi:uncharacterized membrane protein